MNSFRFLPCAKARVGLARTLSTVVLTVCLSTAAFAAIAGGASVSVPVTDPDILRELGFEPGAKNVYALPSALDQLEGIAPVIDGVQAKYGTDEASYTRVSASAFVMERPEQSTIHRSIASAFCTPDTNGWNQILADVALPTGVSVEFVNLFAGDWNSTQNSTLFFFESCHEGFAGNPNHTLLGSIATTGDGGGQIRTIAIDPPITTQSAFNCSYNLRVRLGNTQTECFGGDASTGLSIRHVAVNWKRQISPAPGIATFGDVSTGHPFFQHIEALADSGITAGCGGGNYCPDDPLTRGQMAVFLAKALGLHFPL